MLVQEHVALSKIRFCVTSSVDSLKLLVYLLFFWLVEFMNHKNELKNLAAKLAGAWKNLFQS